MCIRQSRNPVQCIVPPYMQEKIGETDAAEKDNMADSIRRDYLFRSDRNFFTLAPAAIRTALSLLPEKVSVKPVIEVFNSGKSKRNIPGKLICTATNPTTKDADAKRCLRGGLKTWQFYYDLFNRNSIDNAGMKIRQSIHYGKAYGNAFWNGRQMVYGDGNKKYYNSFTSDIDIIGHELTHGVIQYEANFDYEFQPGALNESCADVFGILIKQFALNQDVKKSNWLIGENIMMGDKYALRSIRAPGSAYTNHPVFGNDPQPATMSDFLKLPYEDDYGGVHYNSGIPNFAFYIAAYNLGGNAWEKMGRIWYAALCDRQRVSKQCNFLQFKRATIFHARLLFGKGSLALKATMAGWKEAGL